MKESVKRIFIFDCESYIIAPKRWRQNRRAFEMLKRKGWKWDYYDMIFV